ncbi:MAG: transporter ATP-binding protein, partial [Microbacteriaceae bacterium]|nr:transporter ATP-binding protein [Microbacteriaceae bacterium]
SRAVATVTDLSFSVAPGSVTLLDGRSGSGKSTVLAAVAGRLPQGATVDGVVTGVDRGRLAWLPQHPRFVADTFAGELEVYGASLERATGLLDELGLADLDTATASPGELRRLAVARVVARVEAGADLVVLDEPTAQLDARAADRVIALLEPLRGRVTMLVASHDSRVRALADRVVTLGASAAGTSTVEGEEGERRVIHRPGAPDGRPGRALRDFLRPVRGRMLGTVVLGTLATLFAVSLTGLSGWLIVRASEHPPIMYLLVAIVGVRFFGIGRAVLRYGERLVGHDTAFRATTGLRMRLWAALARATDRRRLTAGASLDRLVRDADRVRDLVLRTVVPIVAGYLTLAAFGVVAVALERSLAPLWFVLAAGVAAPVAALWGDRLATRGSEELRSTALRRFAAMLVAADDLRGNGVDGGVRDGLAAIDRRAGASARRSSWALGLGSAVVIAACGITAVLLGASGGLQAGLGAMLALSALALAEPLTDAVAAIQLVPALRHSLAAVDLEPVADAAPRRAPARIDSLDLDGLSAGWNGEPVVTDATAHASRGDLLAITGPSGSGKSTIASVLLGQAAPIGGSYRLDGVDASDLDLRGRIGWCPQESHLFDSTLRANLLIARERGEAPSEREMRDALGLVGLGGLLAGLPDGLDTRVGREGSRLSGGERQRVAVARALLTGCDVIVIDEPTAHLDEETAEALMRDLRVALAERIGVLVTHHPYGLRESDPRLRLGGHALAAA